MIVHITRFAFAVAGAMGGFAISRIIDWTNETGYPEYFVIFIFIILFSAIGYILGGILGRELAHGLSVLEEKVSELAPIDFILGAAGIAGGMLVGFVLSQPLQYVSPRWLAATAAVAIYAMAAVVGWRLAIIKRDDIAAAFPSLSARQAAGSADEPQQIKLLDTSAIIDGRFLELVDLGVLEGDLRVPRFVLAELQTLADSADDTKRARGRRGLDLLARIRADESVELFEADYPDIPEVDGKLIRLAADTEGAIITVDYNLSKVAEVRGIPVVNISDVAAALKPAFLPGESLRLTVVREGKEPEQGVGYLEDGTMVVVQKGREYVGSVVDSEVTSVLQTSGGRMIFANFVRLAEEVAANA
jgi:uncharacterized protein YacL